MGKKKQIKKEAKADKKKGQKTSSSVAESHASLSPSPPLDARNEPGVTEIDTLSVIPSSLDYPPETTVIQVEEDERHSPEAADIHLQREEDEGPGEDVAQAESLADPMAYYVPQLTDDEENGEVDWDPDPFEETAQMLDDLEKVLEEADALHGAPAEVTEKASEGNQHEKGIEENPEHKSEEPTEDAPEDIVEEEVAPAHVEDEVEEKPAQGTIQDPAESVEHDLPDEERAPEPDYLPDGLPEDLDKSEKPEVGHVKKKRSKRRTSIVHPQAPMPLPSPVPSEPHSVHSHVSDHPLSRHGSPLAYHTSPTYRYANPHMHPYNPHAMAMNGPPPMMNPGSVAPSTASFATAYHSPVMNYAAMAPHYAYARRPSGLTNDGYYNGRMDRTLSGGSGQSHGHRTEKTSGQTEEKSHEHHHLMGRIEKVMPDITRMLDSFKEVQGKLQAREAEARQLQSQHEQAVMHKDFYIEALQGQMRKAATETAEEYTKLKNVISALRLELGNQQDKVKDLEEALEASRKENEELEEFKTELQNEIQALQLRIEELQQGHERALEEAKEHERAELSLQKEELTNLFEEIRVEDENAANDRYNDREKELLDEQEALKSAWEKEKQQLDEARTALETEHEKAMSAKQEDWDNELKAAQSDLQAARDALTAKTGEFDAKENELQAIKTRLKSKVIELEEAQSELALTNTKFDTKQAELETNRAELNSTLEKLTALQSELEGVQKELEEMHEQHAADQEKLAGSHVAELDVLRGTHSTQLDNLRSIHKNAAEEADSRYKALMNEIEQKEKTWATEKSNLERQLAEKTEELVSLEREKEALERGDVAREKQLQAAVDEMRRTIDNMESDRDKLRKTLESLGEATDLKTSKGDQFFLDAFGQLRKLIVDLSTEHFSYLPIDPPKDILDKIPPEMPSFLDNTAASRELRAAYVQHVISKTLTYRIFQPFLFTLGRRYDKADTFFQVLSMDIRRKSVRRETFWRQQTLKAAFTTSEAKQAINVAAGIIVDEIVDHIRHFTDPKHLDTLLTGVRRIAKLAVETWRHARLERELVIATMPAPEAEGVINEEWEEYTCGRTVDACNPSTKNARHILLRVFPRIYREAAHEDFADDEEKVNACVYFPGMVLYSDSPSVLARRDEQGRKSPVTPIDNADKTRSSSRASQRKSPVTATA